MRRISLLLALAGLVVGCGGGSPRIDTKTVIDHFQKRTQLLLTRDSKLSSSTWDVLNLDRADDPDNKYGTFSIYVVHKPKADDVLTTTVDGTKLKPDEHGIYWENDTTVPGAEFWSGMKRYGPNVVLSFIAGDVKGTDAAFDRVNSILTDLPGA